MVIRFLYCIILYVVNKERIILIFKIFLKILKDTVKTIE